MHSDIANLTAAKVEAQASIVFYTEVSTEPLQYQQDTNKGIVEVSIPIFFDIVDLDEGKLAYAG